MSSVTKLTPREIEILNHVARGELNKTIAHELKLSENTVKVHVRNICKKLGTNNRSGAVFLYLRESTSNSEVKPPVAEDEPSEKASQKPQISESSTKPRVVMVVITESEWREIEKYLPTDWYLYNGQPKRLDVTDIVRGKADV